MIYAIWKKYISQKKSYNLFGKNKWDLMKCAIPVGARKAKEQTTSNHVRYEASTRLLPKHQAIYPRSFGREREEKYWRSWWKQSLKLQTGPTLVRSQTDCRRKQWKKPHGRVPDTSSENSSKTIAARPVSCSVKESRCHIIFQSFWSLQANLPTGYLYERCRSSHRSNTLSFFEKHELLSSTLSGSRRRHSVVWTGHKIVEKAGHISNASTQVRKFFLVARRCQKCI